MRLKCAILFHFALIPVVPLMADELLLPISMRGGVDFSRNCSDIEDWRACDSNNMYGDRVGSADTRNGSERLNSTAVSTNPFSSLFWTTISTSTQRINVLIGVSGHTIYYSTDSVFSRWSVLYSSLSAPNQKFTFAVAQNDIYMTGNALTDQIFRWDVTNSSFGAAILNGSSTFTPVFFAKYLLYEKGYLLAAHIRDVKGGLTSPTTTYDDRIMYSYLLQPSSFSVDQAINITPGDGQYLTGLTSKRSGFQGVSLVEAYKPTSATSISFKTLAPAGVGGDQEVTKMADGFGHAAEQPPENIGAWDVLLSLDGILLWNGGMIARSNLEAERIVISGRIKPLIDKLIRSKTYGSAYVKYYPKSNYLIFCYEDPDRFPQGRINSVLFYDFITGEWWPMKNWLAASMETDNGPNGTGRLHYGDAMDGYVHIADDPAYSDDSRKEISLDAMEKTDNWANSGISNAIVAVGSASLTLSLTGSVRTSSITRVFVMPMGEWYDKTASSSTDMISFKVNPSSRGFLSIIRVDLEVNDAQNQFDTYFSSVTISSAALTAGSSAWSLIEIPFSSFTILPSWTDLETETLPFARNLTRFGIRFVATGTQGLTLHFDDLRFVQATKNPINQMRLTKRFNFGTIADKDFKQVALTREKQRDSNMHVDVLTGQGYLANTIIRGTETPKEIFVCGFASMTGISRLNSVDMSVLDGTTTLSSNSFEFENGNADPTHIYSYDVTNTRLVKIARPSMTIFVSTYGSLGSGASNFNYVQDIAPESNPDGNILVTDHMNHRLKEHKKKGLTFVRQYGQLGFGSTSFYNPTGADWDNRNIYVCDDGNQALKKFDRDYKFEKQAILDINTIGNCAVRVTPQYAYVAYNRGSDIATYFIDVVLEKRNKGDLSLVKRVVLRPDGVVANSTYSIRGTIGLHSKFVTVSFNDNALIAGNFYLQKRLQSDLTLVDEVVSQSSMLGVIADGLQREPSQKTDKINLGIGKPDPFIQLKFYAKDELESAFKLSEMSILADALEYTP